MNFIEGDYIDDTQADVLDQAMNAGKKGEEGGQCM